MVRYCWRCAAPLPAVPPTTCAACGEIHYVNPKPCGNAVVLREAGSAAGGREVLMLLRARDPDGGCWTIPGGFCEAGEHPMHAAERELHEEVGRTGRAVAHLGAWMDVYGPPEADGLGITTVVSGYLVTLDEAGQGVPGTPGAEFEPDPAEALAVGWWPVGDLPRPLAFPGHVRPMIHEAAAVWSRGGAPCVRPLPDRTW